MPRGPLGYSLLLHLGVLLVMIFGFPVLFEREKDWEPLALTVQTEDGAQPKAAADPYEDSDEVSRSLSPYGGSF